MPVYVLFLAFSAFIAFMILITTHQLYWVLSGITDSILFFLHYLAHKGKLEQWYDQSGLRIICRYGIIVATAGLLCLGYFTTIQVMYKKPIMPIADSSVISIVWSIVALRSGLILMYYCIGYQKNDDETRLLVTNEEIRSVEIGPEEEEK
ncbi:hypothetical protein NQ317_016334 [Molorchus minor]|uniref:Uncharacterized protein n=1 Tax=Molorchus minor TaxID=1323400 RepID=A0ABQ9J220_9CUCU|nr:hypothetical protein NQ317_016334 [Molorchus minor]